jgi:hemoglobin
MSDQNELTVYEMVGGAATFRKLVDLFYARVEQDLVLRAMFPDDLEPGKEWQYLFLMQFFGGPQEYGAVRGHPRLRMRHAPFPVTQASRDAWLKHMLDSIDEVGIEEPARGIMREYFDRASTFMINVGE